MLRRHRLALPALLLLATCVVWAAGEGAPAHWTFNATIIEACSCPMFCQCYFNTKPAEHSGHGGHGGGHFCKFNNAFRINKGTYGKVKLDGVRFWVSGDLGGDFSAGKMDWAVLTFDKSSTPEQREALQTIVPKIYQVEWNSFSIAEGVIDTWKYDETGAHATIDGGKTAEVKLKSFAGMNDEPVVIRNLKYWSAPRNDGFRLMPNEVEAYRVGDKAFEFNGTNGFMVTLDATSDDFAQGG